MQLLCIYMFSYFVCNVQNLSVISGTWWLSTVCSLIGSGVNEWEAREDVSLTLGQVRARCGIRCLGSYELYFLLKFQCVLF